MIELNDDNDPMLFAVTLPSGERLILQYMEVVTNLSLVVGNGTDPTPAQIASAIRDSARVKLTLDNTDAHLMAAWHRISAQVANSGNA
jgi:hypothetical protein